MAFIKQTENNSTPAEAEFYIQGQNTDEVESKIRSVVKEKWNQALREFAQADESIKRRIVQRVISRGYVPNFESDEERVYNQMRKISHQQPAISLLQLDAFQNA